MVQPADALMLACREGPSQVTSQFPVHSAEGVLLSFFIPAPSLCLHEPEMVRPAPARRAYWSYPSLKDPPDTVF